MVSIGILVASNNRNQGLYERESFILTSNLTRCWAKNKVLNENNCRTACFFFACWWKNTFKKTKYFWRFLRKVCSFRTANLWRSFSFHSQPRIFPGEHVCFMFSGKKWILRKKISELDFVFAVICSQYLALKKISPVWSFWRENI